MKVENAGATAEAPPVLREAPGHRRRPVKLVVRWGHHAPRGSLHLSPRRWFTASVDPELRAFQTPELVSAQVSTRVIAADDDPRRHEHEFLLQLHDALEDAPTTPGPDSKSPRQARPKSTEASERQREVQNRVARRGGRVNRGPLRTGLRGRRMPASGPGHGSLADPRRVEVAGVPRRDASACLRFLRRFRSLREPWPADQAWPRRLQLLDSNDSIEPLVRRHARQ